jgi:UDP-N-acetylmuramoyl-L-alanyl-D-glutamate--2,6-diaminopimelate ligase
MAGVTGTNGKTTVAYMLRDILHAAHGETGLIGTVEYRIGPRTIPASRTTPDAVSLQSILAQMVRAGCRSCVMEVSSHAIVQRRVLGVDYDTVIFTNLTRDHLDYHGSMEGYFQAKAALFMQPPGPKAARTAVVNIDDPSGRRIVAMQPPGDLLTFGVSEDADVRAEGITFTDEGTRFEVRTPWGGATLGTRLMGRFNVSNILAAMAAGGAMGADVGAMAGVLSGMGSVRGRLELVWNRDDIRVFVDYAHTDDALRNVLTTLRELTSRRLLVVFGCGGDRDPTKRPEMGRAADELADFTVLTSDNPRTEDPAAIVEAIRAGFAQADRYEVVLDREAAIRRALDRACPGDVVLVAGKGHETFQEFENRTLPFDDREVVRRVMKHA